MTKRPQYWLLISMLSVALTSSGCRWGWFPARRLWSGPRSRSAEGWSSESWWWLSALPGRRLATPFPQSTGTTRCRLQEDTHTKKTHRSPQRKCSLWLSQQFIMTGLGIYGPGRFGCAHFQMRHNSSLCRSVYLKQVTERRRITCPLFQQLGSRVGDRLRGRLLRIFQGIWGQT